MWDDVESANALNSGALFSGIYYDRNVGRMHPVLRDHYFASTKQVLQDFAAIKHGHAYRAYLGKKLGYDFAKSFHYLQDSVLVLTTPSILSRYDDCLLTSYHDRLDIYSYGLHINQHSMMHYSPTALKTLISHEIGHGLINASYMSPLDNIAPIRRLETNDYRQRWRDEFDADRLAIAADPYNNNIGVQHSERNDPTERLNALHKDNPIPSVVASVMAGFYMARDDMLIRQSRMIGTDLVTPFNRHFKMNCALTHPSTFARTVKAEKFARKCVSFLQNRKD